MQHLFAPRCSLWKFWILAIVAWRILLRKCPLSSHESLFSIPCCREDRDTNPCSTSAFFATQLNFLELRLYFFAFRYDRGNISELSWFSWDADNSKLVDRWRNRAQWKLPTCCRECHVERQIAGGGEYEVQESPEHCLVRLTFSAHPVLRTSMWRGWVWASSGGTLMRKFVTLGFVYTSVYILLGSVHLSKAQCWDLPQYSRISNAVTTWLIRFSHPPSLVFSMYYI